MMTKLLMCDHENIDSSENRQKTHIMAVLKSYTLRIISCYMSIIAIIDTQFLYY